MASSTTRRGVTVKDVAPDDFVRAYAAHLKKSGKIELPKWIDYAKTGSFKELAPVDPDWYYIRAASLARHIYVRPASGVGALSNRYGGASRRGTRKQHHTTACTGVIRHILKQLESIEVLEKHPRGGRRVSSTGRRDLDRIASTIA
jgi:small subunit ribosomal protein S19e